MRGRWGFSSERILAIARSKNLVQFLCFMGIGMVALLPIYLSGVLTGDCANAEFYGKKNLQLFDEQNKSDGV